MSVLRVGRRTLTVAADCSLVRLDVGSPVGGTGTGGIHRRLQGDQATAYGIVHQFAGGTEEQYRASIAAVHPSDGSLPEGQVFHVAGASSDGWVIVAIHESEESWGSFRDGILMPRMQAGIAGGFQTPPQETAFEVSNQQSA